MNDEPYRYEAVKSLNSYMNNNEGRAEIGSVAEVMSYVLNTHDGHIWAITEEPEGDRIRIVVREFTSEDIAGMKEQQVLEVFHKAFAL